MMMTKNIYNAIVAEVEEMSILVMSNDVISKVKYVKVGDRKFRVSFWWDARLNESVVKVEEKRNIYEEVLVWDSAETDETFPDFFMNFIKESIKNEINARVNVFMSINEGATEEDKKVLYERECERTSKYCGFTVEELMGIVGYKKGAIVDIKEVENLEMGEAKKCHLNSAIYAIENDCNFVCGWLYSNGKYPIPHCINEKDGKYFDTTLNRNGKFKIYHTYTADEIKAIYDEVGVSFIPFETVYSESQKDFYVFDGNERVTADRYNDFMDYINKMRWSNLISE